jgi:hypothetical protein
VAREGGLAGAERAVQIDMGLAQGRALRQCGRGGGGRCLVGAGLAAGF